MGKEIRRARARTGPHIRATRASRQTRASRHNRARKASRGASAPR